jgi:hypothetical protein
MQAQARRVQRPKGRTADMREEENTPQQNKQTNKQTNKQ